jgi:hypothetical protein
MAALLGGDPGGRRPADLGCDESQRTAVGTDQDSRRRDEGGKGHEEDRLDHY